MSVVDHDERKAMARPDKVAAVAEIKGLLEAHSAAVLTEYRGLSVAQMKDLRVKLGESASYAVVKNTLTAIAAKEAGISAFDGQLAGPTAIAFIKGEAVDVAKVLRDFAKANPQLVIKAGYLDGDALTAEDITKLADLDSREVLLGKAAGAMKGKLYQAAYMFQAPLAQAARTVDALRAKQEEGDEAA